MNTEYEYIYFYVEENRVAQAHRIQVVDGRIVYNHETFGDETWFDMSEEVNKNAVWTPVKFGEKTELVSNDGFEYEVYSDPRDAFRLSYGSYAM